VAYFSSEIFSVKIGVHLVLFFLLGLVEVTGLNFEVFAVLNCAVDHHEQIADALLVVDVEREKLDKTVIILKHGKGH